MEFGPEHVAPKARRGGRKSSPENPAARRSGKRKVMSPGRDNNDEAESLSRKTKARTKKGSSEPGRDQFDLDCTEVDTGESFKGDSESGVEMELGSQHEAPRAKMSGKKSSCGKPVTKRNTKRKAASSVQDDDDIDVDEAQSSAGGPKVRNEEESLKSLSMPKEKRPGRPPRRIRAQRHLDKKVSTSLSAKGEESRGKPAKGEDFSPTTPGGSKKPAEISPNFILATIEEESKQEVSCTKSGGIGRNDDPEQDVTIMKRRERNSVCSVSKPASSSGKSSDKLFYQLEPGSKFVTKFGVVEVIADNRLPSDHHKSTIDAKELKKFYTRRERLNARRMKLFDQIAAGTRYRRQELNKIYLESTRTRTNGVCMTQMKIWDLYCRSTTPTQILARGSSRDGHNNDLMNGKTIEENVSDPRAPRDFYPDRIIECKLVEEVINGPARGGIPPDYAGVKHFKSSNREKPSAQKKTMPMRLFIARRELTRVYDSSKTSYVDNRSHFSMGVCLTKKEKRQQRIKEIEAKALSEGSCCLDRLLSTLHGVTKGPDSRRRTDPPDFGNPHLIKKSYHHRMPPWLIFQAPRSSMYPETYFSLEFRRGSQNRNHFNKLKQEEGYKPMHERIRLRKPSKRSEMNGSKEHERPNEDADQLEGEGVRLRAAGQIMASRKGRQWRKAITKTQTGRFAMRPVPRRQAKTKTAAGPARRARGQRLLPGRGSGLRPGASSPPPAQEKSGGGARASGWVTKRSAKRTSASSVQDDDDIDVDEAQSPAWGPKVRNEEVSLKSPSTPKEKRLGYPTTRIRAGHHSDNKVPTCLSAKGEESRGKQAKGENFSPTTPGGSEKPAEIYSNSNLASKEEESEQEVSFTKSGGIGRNGDPEQDVAIMKRRKRHSDYSVSKLASSSGKSSDKLFYQLEPGSKFVTKFGVVEVIADNRLPSDHHKSTIDAKELKNFYSRRDRLNARRMKLFDQIAAGTRYRRQELNKIYLESTRTHTNDALMTQMKIWDLYCRSTTPTQILAKGSSRDGHNNDLMNGKTIAENVSDPRAPRDFYPDRIIECKLVEEVIIGSARGGIPPDYAGVNHFKSSNREKLSVQKKTMPMRLFIARRELTRVYDSSKTSYVDNRSHFSTGVCLTKKEKRQQRIKEIEAKALSEGSCCLDRLLSTLHGVTKGPDSRRSTDLPDFGNPHLIKKSYHHRMPPWLIFQAPRSSMYPETYFSLEFKRGSQNRNHFNELKKEEGYKPMHERIRLRKARKRSEMNGSKERERPNEDADQPEGEAVRLRAAGQIMASRKGRYWRKATTKTQTGRFAMRPVSRGQAKTKTAAGPGLRGRGQWLPPGRESGLRPGSSSPLPTQEKSGGGARASGWDRFELECFKVDVGESFKADSESGV